MMNQPIRVLHVIGIMNRGGAEAMIMNLYRKIDRTKVQFDFVENTYEKAAYDDEIQSLGGIIYHCPHYNGKNHFEYVHWWKEFFNLHRGEYAIVHGHIGSTAAIYLKIAKKSGVFTIAHSHNSGTDHSLNSYLYFIFSYPTRFIADYFFACSQIAGADRFGQRVVSSSSYSVFHNGIDTNDFSFSKSVRDQVRSELGIENKIVIGHIGRFEKQKNHRLLLDIFRCLKQKQYNCMLLLVGDGPLRTEMMEYAKTIGISGSVIFLGVRSDVNRLVQAMDFFVFPSLHEGLPVTLVETQTSGLPCVISDGVPAESILTNNLISVMGLKDTPEQWADHIVNRFDEERYDRSREVIEAGYDISTTAKWLEEFYLEKYREH